ncbi:MAG: hypothetical protein HQM14_19565 [SAR324 cluster bacterium]|nr:hypothetical protein [SAR324 cluster bacterium]
MTSVKKKIKKLTQEMEAMHRENAAARQAMWELNGVPLQDLTTSSQAADSLETESITDTSV